MSEDEEFRLPTVAEEAEYRRRRLWWHRVGLTQGIGEGSEHLCEPARGLDLPRRVARERQP